MKTLKKIPFMAAVLILVSLPAMALELSDARKQGMIGEKTDGYVAVIKSSGDVKALVSEVNAKRKAEYTRISKENGQSVDVVAKLASPQIISGLPAGSLYQGSDGAWKTR